MDKCVEIEASECRNIFASDPDEIGEKFMQIWLRIICEKEDGLILKKDRQTVS